MAGTVLYDTNTASAKLLPSVRKLSNVGEESFKVNKIVLKFCRTHKIPITDKQLKRSFFLNRNF